MKEEKMIEVLYDSKAKRIGVFFDGDFVCNWNHDFGWEEPIARWLYSTQKTFSVSLYLDKDMADFFCSFVNHAHWDIAELVLDKDIKFFTTRGVEIENIGEEKCVENAFDAF